jgi:hypothetical protein
MMAFSGVRSSWLMLARNSLLLRLASSAPFALAPLLLADVRHRADDAAVARPPLADPQPMSVGQLHLEGARRIDVALHALAHPFLDAAARLRHQALGGDGARDLLEAGADHDQVGAGAMQLAKLLVEQGDAVLHVVEHESLGDALERVDQPLLGLGGHGFGGSAGADVADQRDVHRCAALLHLRHRQVDREGRAVAPASHDAARRAAAPHRGQQRRGGAGAVAEAGGSREQGREALADDLLRRMAEDALGGGIERADRAEAVDRQQPVEGVVDDAPHERVLVAQRQALRQQPHALILDPTGEADAVGGQHAEDQRRGIDQHRQLHLDEGGQGLDAQDDGHGAGQAHAPRPDAESGPCREDQDQRRDDDERPWRAMQIAILQQRFRREGLDEGTGQDAAHGHREHVAELGGAGADDHVLVAHERRFEGSLEHAHERELGDGFDVDAVVDIEGVRAFALGHGEQHRQSRHVAVRPEIGDVHLPHRAVAIRIDVQRGDARMLGEGRDRLGVFEAAAADVAVALLEHRQDHPLPMAAERIGKTLVLRRGGDRAEVDVERDVGRAGRKQAIEDLGIDRARPRPDADLLQAVGIDLDDGQRAGRRTGRESVADIVELVVDEIEPAE